METDKLTESFPICSLHSQALKAKLELCNKVVTL